MVLNIEDFYGQNKKTKPLPTKKKNGQLNRSFTKEDWWMAHRHMEMCSTLVTQKIQIQTIITPPNY